MTWRNLQIYEALQCWQASRNYPPTVRELADACGLASGSTVHLCLRRLRVAGLVGWRPGCSRTLWVVR